MNRKISAADEDYGRTNNLSPVVSPSRKGERSEAPILHALIASRRVVLMPWGTSQRYDFAIDDGDGRITRVQCNTGVYRDGAVFFRSADRRRPMGDPYLGQIDAFAVYSSQLHAAYLVPIADIPVRQLAALRIEPPANGQIGGIRWAKPYQQPWSPAAELLERKTRFELATPYLAVQPPTHALTKARKHGQATPLLRRLTSPHHLLARASVDGLSTVFRESTAACRCPQRVFNSWSLLMEQQHEHVGFGGSLLRVQDSVAFSDACELPGRRPASELQPRTTNAPKTRGAVDKIRADAGLFQTNPKSWIVRPRI
jgi:hypothetical protein